MMTALKNDEINASEFYQWQMGTKSHLNTTPFPTKSLSLQHQMLLLKSFTPSISGFFQKSNKKRYTCLSMNFKILIRFHRGSLRLKNTENGIHILHLNLTNHQMLKTYAKYVYWITAIFFTSSLSMFFVLREEKITDYIFIIENDTGCTEK